MPFRDAISQNRSFLQNGALGGSMGSDSRSNLTNQHGSAPDNKQKCAFKSSSLSRATKTGMTLSHLEHARTSRPTGVLQRARYNSKVPPILSKEGFWWGRPDLNRRPLPGNSVQTQFLRVSPDRSRTSSSHVLVRKPVNYALEPVVIPA
jgi:hypothetical protein